MIAGLAVLHFALQRVGRGRQAFFIAWLWGVGAGLLGLAFVPAVVATFTSVGYAGGVLALVLLAMFQALAWGVGGWFACLLERRTGLSPPLSFGAGVLLAISLPGVFGWTPAGVSTPWPWFVQLADLIGERGVSFLFAVSAALFATAVESGRTRRERVRASVMGAALLGLLGLHGVIRIAEVQRAHAELPTLNVGVVQAAVPARLRWQPEARHSILQRLRRLTSKSEAEGAELSIWPEAAYTFALPHRAGPMPRGSRAVVGGAVRGPVLFGLITEASDEAGQHNATTLVDRQRVMQLPQAKLELLWFGESIPLSAQLPWLRRLFFRAGGLVPGREVALLRHGDARIGVLNCYEDTLPAVGRRIAAERPNLLVNVTNDAWFGPTSEPELHLRLAVMRAVETRLDLVRAVNLGVPAWIDASGTIRARGNASEQGVMQARPALNDMSPTLYVRIGDVPLWFGLFAAALAAALRSRRRAQTGEGVTERDP